MGKSYIENSLKRFLKRKVKITLGLVVTFLITGIVGFADIGEELEKAENIILNLGNSMFDKNDTEKKINVSYNSNSIEIIKEENNNLTVDFSGITDINSGIATKSLTFSNDLLTVKGAESLKNMAEKIKGTSVITTAEKGKENSVNNGVINFTEVYDGGSAKEFYEIKAAQWGTDITNNGIIISPNGAQYTSEKGTAVNNGILYGNDYLQRILLRNSGNLINNGVIIAFSGGQSGSRINNSNLVNNGLIISNKETGKGQSIWRSHGHNTLINNGVIKGFEHGQYIQGYDNDNPTTSTNTVLLNYGIIDCKNGQSFGWNSGDGGEVTNSNSKAENYGIINAEKYGQYTVDKIADGQLNNYGIIKGTDYGQYSTSAVDIHIKNYGLIDGQKQGIHIANGSVENYGVIKIDEVDLNSLGTNKNLDVKDFIVKQNQDIDLNIKNVGINIVKSDNPIPQDYKLETGILLNKKYELQNKDTAVNITAGEIINSKTFENNKNAAYVHLTNNKTTKIEGNIDGVTIGAVIENGKENTKVFEYTNGEPFREGTIKNSNILGYFTGNSKGTVLEISGDLFLENTVVSAVRDEINGGVSAVNIGEGATLTVDENSKIVGKITGQENAGIIFESSDNKDISLDISRAVFRNTGDKLTDVVIRNGKIDNLSFAFHSGDKISKITVGKDTEVGTLVGLDSTSGTELTLENIDNIKSDILMGTGNDTITIYKPNEVSEKSLGKMIDGNGGDDTVNLKNSNGKHDTFDYALKNIETLDLGNSSWKIGTNASISHDTVIKAGEKTTIQNGTLLGELTGNTENTDFINSKNVNNILENSSFGENAEFQIGIGKGMELKAGAEYNINDTTAENLGNIAADKITASAIFTEATEQGKDIRVKSAEEMNIDERYSGIYNEMLENASSNEEILNVLNNSSASEIADTINSKGALGDTLATTGYKITRDITNSFMSAVNEWDKKANKGEWLANAKYISSDVEYDGANNVKGYDSDINSMVGMIEYGVSENTSYGIALGGGDTEVDVKGAGTLEGDNYYIGAYAKHSVNGFDLVGNLGYTISDLDVDSKGSADSSAVTLGGYIKKDIALTETVRLEPNFAFTYDYIMQDNAEGNGVKVDNKDIHVFEATAGVNIVKGFNLEKGILELKTGVKYSMADINRNEETIISVYGIDDINLGNPKVDKTRGTAHVGFDYEHETGFGVNGKYEMMWSDSGDDSRITAGVSYRF